MAQGHIRKRGENTYQIIYPLGRGPDGKKKYGSETIKGTLKDAQVRRAQIIAGLDSGDFVHSGKGTIGDYLLRWLAEIKSSIRPKTYRSYEQITRLYLIPHIGAIQLGKLSPLHVQAMYRKLLEEGRAGKTATGNAGEGLSPTTVRVIHRTLKSALAKAVEWGLIAKSPADRVEQPAKVTKDPKTLTPEEAVRFLEATKPTGRYSLYLAALTTGMRQGELLGLRWSDVNLEKGIATVTQQLISAGEEPVFGEPKTKHGNRIVILSKNLVKALAEDWSNEAAARHLPGSTCGKYDLVWHVVNGNPISARNLDRQFKSVLQKSGCPDIRFHDLRHTHATMLLESGVHPKIVQERLGHSDIAVTLNTYSHVMPILQGIAADQIDSILEPKKKQG